MDQINLTPGTDLVPLFKAIGDRLTSLALRRCRECAGSLIAAVLDNCVNLTCLDLERSTLRTADMIALKDHLRGDFGKRVVFLNLKSFWKDTKLLDMIEVVLQPGQLPRLQELRLHRISKEDFECVADWLHTALEGNNCLRLVEVTNPTHFRNQYDSRNHPEYIKLLCLRDRINLTFNGKLLNGSDKLALLSVVKEFELSRGVGFEQPVIKSIFEFAHFRVRRIIDWTPHDSAA